MPRRPNIGHSSSIDKQMRLVIASENGKGRAECLANDRKGHLLQTRRESSFE